MVYEKLAVAEWLESSGIISTNPKFIRGNNIILDFCKM